MRLIPPRTGELIGDSAGRRVEILSDDDGLHATWSRFGPRRDGADLHVHHGHSDLFYVLDGELTLRLGPGGEPAIAPKGSFVYVPPLVVHGFRNGGDADLLYLNFHVPGSGFADYLRARRDGVEGSFDQHDPPADGGQPPELARIGRERIDVDEIAIAEHRLEPASAHEGAARRRRAYLYVLAGTLALDGVRAEAGTWVREPPHSVGCAGSEPVRFLRIHV